MKTLRLLFLILVLFASIKSEAQLSIAPTTLDSLHQNIFNFGDTISMTVKVTNTTGFLFSDTVLLRYSINGQLFTSPNPSGINYLIELDSIPAHGSITKTLFFGFTGPNFSVGPSVVVIWPRANSAQNAVDSISGAVNIVSNPDSLFISPNVLVTAFPAPSDTVHLGDTVSKSIPVFNFGDSVFNQTISFDYSINGVAYHGMDTSSLNAISSFPGISIINPGGTGLKELHFNFSQPYFTPGPSVVVIWPRARYNTITRNSATITFYILAANNIIPLGKDQLMAYMANQQLVIASSVELKAVKVYNLQGALVLEREVIGYASIPMNPYPTGIYFAEITLADNSRRVFKIYNPPAIR